MRFGSTSVSYTHLDVYKRQDQEQLTKPVHVISTDTLVENPVIAAYVSGALKKMNEAAADQRLPIQAHRLTPKLEDRYFSRLIGHGYASPRPK